MDHSKLRFIISNNFQELKPSDYLAEEKIIIYRQGRKVIAKSLYTGESAEAKCNPSDTFDFKIGAKLAFDRLIPDKKPAEPESEGFTGKAVFVGTGVSYFDSDFTIGKIYIFRNGKTIDNDGNCRPSTQRRRWSDSILRKNLGFLPIVE